MVQIYLITQQIYHRSRMKFPVKDLSTKFWQIYKKLCTFWYWVSQGRIILRGLLTAWQMSKYGVFSGPYFSVFSPNTGKYGPEKTLYLDIFHAVTTFVFPFCIGLITYLNDSNMGVLKHFYITKTFDR